MKRSPHNKNDIPDIVPESDVELDFVADENEVTELSLKDKLKLLRDELTETRKERDENLAGWQRAKADLVNYRRMVSENTERDILRAKGSVVRSVIPALDSFETATASESWKTVHPEWREGIERIRTQLVKALTDEGLALFGEIGEPFDPMRHECMSVVPTDTPGKDHTIAQVLQRGYRVRDEIVRPAKVIVAQFPEHT